MTDFLIFYAPFLVLFGAIGFGFWFSLKDGLATKEDK
ncbi:cytochrome bd oxidase small subunit CydS [Planococcus sp. 1R117A]